MIPKRLSDIDEEAIASLIQNGVAEGRTLEYKQALPGGSEPDKKEFLADISSFANSGGGDLIFGVEEKQGVPTRIAGIDSADLDLEIRRMDSLAESGIEPRIRYELKPIACRDGRRLLVIRIERSWTGPHRVILRGHDKFYARNSAGKYPLDVNELRTAFTFPITVTERIRAFRTDRIIAVSNHETPVSIKKNPTILLHCIPLESFASEVQFDLLPLYENPARFSPMGESGWDRRLNLEGLVCYDMNDPKNTYTQLYRSGIIEAVSAYHLGMEYRGEILIPSVAYEETILQYLSACLDTQKQLGVGTPIFVALSLLGTRGLRMGVEPLSMSRGYPITNDTIILPEQVVSDFSTSANKILKPAFDLVWNACGFRRSRNFDSEGNWSPRTGIF